MSYELESVKNDLTIEKFAIISLEKLDNNYIRIIGKSEYKDIDVITNGIFTFNFSPFSKVKSIINYNGIDYLIAENIFGELFLISLNNGVRLIKKAKEIKYIDDGLFGVSTKKRFSAESVYDLITHDYIPIPDNMVFSTYKDGVLTLQESDKETFEKHEEIVIDRNGNIIIPKVDGRITIIDHTKFMTNNMVIDLNQLVMIEDADLIMPLPEDKIKVLKTLKHFDINHYFVKFDTYMAYYHYENQIYDDNEERGLIKGRFEPFDIPYDDETGTVVFDGYLTEYATITNDIPLLRYLVSRRAKLPIMDGSGKDITLNYVSSDAMEEYIKSCAYNSSLGGLHNEEADYLKRILTNPDQMKEDKQ